MHSKVLRIAGLSLIVAALAGCATGPTKPLPPQVAAVIPTAYMVIADGAVGLAVSKGVRPQDIAEGAFQLQKFSSGQPVSVQALTTEIQKLEAQANFNPAQVAAVTQLRMAFDTIVLGYVQGGVISGTAQTTLTQIFSDVIMAAELLGAIPPTAAADPAEIGPPAAAATQRPGAAMAALESPQLVGAATSTLIVASLQAFKHITVGAPAAAAITVLATFTAGFIDHLTE